MAGDVVAVWRCRRVLVLGFLGVLVACGGGGGGGGTGLDSNDDAEPARTLAMVSTLPVDGAVDVDRRSTVRLNFDSSLLASTVSNDAILLESAGVPVAASVQLTASGDALEISPDEPLALNRTYSVSVQSSLRDIQGGAVAAGTGLSFDVSDGEWRSGFVAAAASNGGSLVDRTPNLALVSPTRAVVTWSGSRAFTAVVSPEAAVGLPELLNTCPGRSCDPFAPDIFATPEGLISAIWNDPDNGRLMARHKSFGEDWTTLEEGLPGVIQYSADHALSGSGVLWSAWLDALPNMSRARVSVNFADASRTWGEPIVLSPEARFGEVQNRSLRLAVNAAGMGRVVWNQFGSGFGIWTRAFSTSGTSDEVFRVDTGATGETNDPSVVIDSDGNAVVVWHKLLNGDAGGSVWARRYSVTEGWGDSERLGPILGDSESQISIRVSLDVDGGVFAVWTSQRTDNVGTFHYLVGRRYRADTGWGSLELIYTGRDRPVGPRLVIDTVGNAVVLWSLSTGSDMGLWVRRYRRQSGWVESEQIVNTPTVPVAMHNLVIGRSGDAVVSWVDRTVNPENIRVRWFH